MLLTTPDTIRTLQRKLYAKAKQQPACRFHALYDKLYRADILSHAWRRVLANRGSPGIDGIDFATIENGMGVDRYLLELCRELQDKTYRASPVRRVMIPKADGSKRPLGIPTIRDRVAQMALMLVMEPIFEADFCEHSYGFRPKKSAHEAIDAIACAMHQGQTQVIDADPVSGHGAGSVEILRQHPARQTHGDRGRTHCRWGGVSPHQTMAESPRHGRQ